MDNIFENGLTAMEVEAKLERVRQSPGGIEKIAAQMKALIIETLLYEGRTRQLYQMHKLNQGEEAVYDVDIRVPAYAMSIDGTPYKAIPKSGRVRIETAPIGSRILLKWTDQNYRKFDLVVRGTERAKSSIQTQEDDRAIKVLDAASDAYNDALLQTTTTLEIKKVIQALATVRNNRHVASKIVLSAMRTADIMGWNIGTGGGTGIFSPATQEVLQKSGRIGQVFGVDLLEFVKGEIDGKDVDIIDPLKVYVCTSPELLGVFTIRQELMSEALKDPNQYGDVIAFMEEVGHFIQFSNGIVRIDVAAA